MRALILGIAIALPAAAYAAQPSALSQVASGLWEISGVPDMKAPVRQCVGDVLALAQFEHRTRKCARSVISDTAGSMQISYDCGAAGFGRSEIEVVTPRALRISTQGISDQLPFNYVIQAHRVGDCEKGPSTKGH